MPYIQLRANDKLRQKLMLMSGSQRAYIAWTYERLPQEVAVSLSWCRQVIGGFKKCPYRLALSLIRLIENDPEMSVADAMELAPRYFDTSKT